MAIEIARRRQGRPIKDRVTYDADLQALMRLRAALAVDQRVDEDTFIRLSEALSYVEAGIRQFRS